MRPHVVCLMEISLDGRIHPSRWTRSPDGDPKAWGKVYEKTHAALQGDAWLVGRVTMAEMSKSGPMPAPPPIEITRPYHFAEGAEKPYAVALDRRGVLDFDKPAIGGDHVVVLVGPDVSDTHLAKLANAGVSYVVAPDAAMDLRAILGVLRSELGIERRLVEGGGKTCGAMLAAGVVDEVSLLVAPAIDGGVGVDGVFDVPEPGGLAGKTQLRLLSAEVVEHGQVHLRYAVLPPA